MNPAMPEEIQTGDIAPTVLPEIPSADLSFDLFSSAIGAPEQEKIQKRASNVMKLAQENEKLKAELKAMTDRLEAAEKLVEERKLGDSTNYYET